MQSEGLKIRWIVNWASIITMILLVGLLTNGIFINQDFRDANNNQSPPYVISIVHPNGGEKWIRGQTYTIEWVWTGSFRPNDRLKIYLYKGDEEYSLIEDDWRIGWPRFAWDIPFSYPLGDDYKILVKTLSAEDFSDNCFSVVDEKKVADLSCSGSLVWSSVEPGDIVRGSFTVRNIGDAASGLHWRVESYPSWGDWTFIPNNGKDLKPNDSTVTVQVFVDAPNVVGASFLGQVLVVNMDDGGDYETLPVSLSTPQNKDLAHPLINYLNNLSQHHPYLFSILRQLLVFLG
jgi:hypothetical protein